MRKPKGTKPGQLVKIIQGENLLAKKLDFQQKYLLGLVPINNNQNFEKNIIVFKFGKPHVVQFSCRFPIGTIGMMLDGKRTKTKRGAVPYFVILVENQIYKIDSNCVEFINC